MKITIEQHVAKNGSLYWTTEHADYLTIGNVRCFLPISHDTFADVVEYLDVWRGIQGVA